MHGLGKILISAGALALFSGAMAANAMPLGDLTASSQLRLVADKKAEKPAEAADKKAAEPAAKEKAAEPPAATPAAAEPAAAEPAKAAGDKPAAKAKRVKTTCGVGKYRTRKGKCASAANKKTPILR